MSTIAIINRSPYIILNNRATKTGIAKIKLVPKAIAGKLISIETANRMPIFSILKSPILIDSNIFKLEFY